MKHCETRVVKKVMYMKLCVAQIIVTSKTNVDALYKKAMI